MINHFSCNAGCVIEDNGGFYVFNGHEASARQEDLYVALLAMSNILAVSASAAIRDKEDDHIIEECKRALDAIDELIEYREKNPYTGTNIAMEK